MPDTEQDDVDLVNEIDNNAANVGTTTDALENGAAPDTGGASAESEGTGGDGTATGAPAKAAPTSEAEQRKLPATTSAPVTNQQLPTQTNQPDPAKAFNDEKAKWGRERSTFQRQSEELSKRLQTFEHEAQQRKAEADRQALKPWNPRHPEAQRTLPRIERVKAFLAAQEGLDPDKRQDLARRLGVTADDAKLHDAYEAHRSETIDNFARDPETFMDNRMYAQVPAMIQEAFRQFTQHQQAVTAVQRDMADPAKIAPHADYIRERIAAGDPYDSIMERVQLKNEIATLKGTVGGVAGREAQVDRKAAAAAERERLAKGSATITRDAKVSGKPDIYEEAVAQAKAKGIQVGSSKFNKLVRTLEEAYNQLS